MITLSNYPFKTTPFAHQLDTWEATKDSKVYAVFWEQGTGKSKLVIDTAAWLYLNGKIDGLVVVAPNGVERNWIHDEVPDHLPDEVQRNTVTHFYQSSKSKTLRHQKACKEVIAHKGFAVLAMAYSAVMTDRGRKTLKEFLTKKRCLYVLDESHAIKTPKAKRTQRILGSSRYAAYRRILTGTPVTNGAFDVYAPMRFLDENFWKDNGLGAYQLFKNYFGVFRNGYNGATKKEFKQLVAFKNLDELHDMLARMSTRVTKDDVLDLPPKLYSKVYVEMTPEQEKIYEAIKTEYMVQLDDEGHAVDAVDMDDETCDPCGIDDLGVHESNAPLAIVRLLRLQQIICGYIVDDDGNMVQLGEKNPRLDALVEISEGLSHKAIIWARFRRDIDLIMNRLGKSRAVRYDGETSTEDRGHAIDSFQRGDAQFFVANPAAAGVGLTLHAAKSVIYYNNSFKLNDRLQSEDRAHRIGLKHPVGYIDLVCAGTVDERIVEALRSKIDVARTINGDTLKEWL